MNTPETDKLEYEQECNYEVAWEDHCRRFETERNEARKQRDELLAAIAAHRSKALPGEDFDQELWQTIANVKGETA